METSVVIRVTYAMVAILGLLQARPAMAEPLSRYVTVNGVRLNYLDWGGKGPPLVMIHGLGDSPHVFDDLAPFLRGRFHVYAYARRGHGHSDVPEGPYDLATLTEDLTQLIDSLGIRQTNLLGWSMGGNEITRFAGLHPERVSKLVYLEAGYDFSDPAFLKSFVATIAAAGPDSLQLRSLDTFRSWCRSAVFGRETPWTPGLEAYLRDITRVGTDGGVQTVPGDRVFGALLESDASSHRDYASVRAPALFLYASSFFPRDPDGPEVNRRVQAFERQADAFREAQVRRVRREVRHATIVRIPGTTHMSIGVRRPDALAKRIREFLLAAR